MERLWIEEMGEDRVGEYEEVLEKFGKEVVERRK